MRKSDLLSRYGDAAETLRALSVGNNALRAALLTAPVGRRHAIAMAALRATEAEPLPDLIENGKVTDLLAFAYGPDHAMTQGVLQRLGAAPLPARLYDGVVALMQSAATRRQLSHFAAPLTRQQIIDLCRLPSDWRDARLLRFSDLSSVAASFDLFMRMMRAACPGATIEDIQASLFATDASSLYDWAERFLISRSRLPLGAHAELSWLKPLRSGRDLAAAGRSYENCLASQISEILSGRRHFSVFRDRGVAIVEFRAWRPLGWYVYHLWAPGNERLDSRIKARAVERLTEIGFAIRPSNRRQMCGLPFLALGMDL